MKYLKWFLVGLVLLPQKALAIEANELPGWDILTRGTVSEIIARTITWILGIAGAIAVAYLVYGGIVYITAAGNEDKAKVGKGVIIHAIIGLVIIALAILIIWWLKRALWGVGAPGIPT